jgi:maltose alpha-D-glucosyltransferase/alpha-amylase
MSVRAPMQWAREPNGGFSTATPKALRRPVVEGRKWGPAAINVADQRRDPDSLLSWMEGLIRRRRETPEIAFGEWSLVPVAEAAVLAMRYDWGARSVLLIHNLGAKPLKTTFKLEPAPDKDGLIDLFGRGDFSCRKDGTVTLELDGYGSRWLRVRRAAESTAS